MKARINSGYFAAIILSIVIILALIAAPSLVSAFGRGYLAMLALM